MKKFCIVQMSGNIVCITIAIIISAFIAKNSVMFVDGSIIIGGILSMIFTAAHIFGYDTATMDLSTGEFKADIMPENVKGKKRFLLFTEVKPIPNEEDNKNDDI